ncbi:hypothetical protein B7H01_19870 [Pandoraea apista]|nr:hypothetical protein B7H01_19870 [Pandoraea apista]
MTKAPSRTADQFVVRFPDGMRDRIASAAKDSGRSMNAEIVARLEKSFQRDTDELSPIAQEKLDRLAAQNEELRNRLDEVFAQVIKTLRIDANAVGENGRRRVSPSSSAAGSTSPSEKAKKP